MRIEQARRLAADPMLAVDHITEFQSTREFLTALADEAQGYREALEDIAHGRGIWYIADAERRARQALGQDGDGSDGDD